jgi:DNA-binding GntR family transcriptional regulator
VETDNSLIQMLGDAAPRRVGAAELIASTIRKQILAGKLQPGEPLPEVQVAAAFGVARNTVREGLKILARSGLAVHELHRGVSVRSLTATDVNNLFGLRAILELAACDRAGALRDAEIHRLAAALETGELALQADDVWGSTMANQAFHRAIVSLLGNPRVEVVHDDVLAELTLGLMLEERDAHAAAEWHARNAEVLELFRQGTRTACRQAVTKYLADSRKHLLTFVQPEGADVRPQATGERQGI